MARSTRVAVTSLFVFHSFASPTYMRILRTGVLTAATVLVALSLAPPAVAQPEIEFEENFPDLTFERPLDMDVDANGRAYVSTQPGKIFTLPNHPSASERTLFLDLTDRVAYSQENQEAGYLNTVLHRTSPRTGISTSST